MSRNKENSATVDANASNVKYIPYSSLCKSPLNVRKKAITGIEGLASNVGAKGLIQNLGKR